MQSWVGYELVKVLVTFGLQPVDFSDSLKEWSSDLYDVFSYMQTRKAELKDNATWILDVLFNDTLHIGHLSKVQFGTKQKFLQRNNTTLSLVICHGCNNCSSSFLIKRHIRMGSWTFLENIVVQHKAFWRIMHHWRTSTSPNIPHNTIWHKFSS